MKTLTLPEAIDLSIVKWTFLAERDWESAECSTPELLKAHPELNKLWCECGLCEYFIEQENGRCYKCPLFKDNLNCKGSKHPYGIWYQSPTSANARVILDWLVRIKDELTSKT